MNRFFFLFALCILTALANPAWAQLFEENFNYTVGDSLTQHGYLISSGTTVNAILTVAPGLTYTGYAPSGIGNAAHIDTTGQDVYKTFPAVSSGSTYLAFMMNVAVAKTGDYFIALSPTASQTNYYARLHLRDSLGLGYRIGLNKSNEVTGGAAYGSTLLLYGSTYLVVVKYTFNTGTTTDDAISVYVLGPSVPPSTEPTVPEIGPYIATSKADAVNLGFVTLRQGSNTSAPRLTIDGIRIGTTWNGVVLNQPVSVLSKKSMAFGNVTVNSTKTDTLTIYNVGASTLSISGVNSTDPAFSVLPLSGSIAPLDSSKFVVSFTPTVSTLYSATINFPSNTATGFDTITATGTGVQAGFSVTPKTLTFGLVAANSTKTDSVVASNVSNTVQLVIDSVVSDNAMFVPLPITATIDTLASHTFTISFTPTGSGHQTGHIVFFHNGPTKHDTVTVNGDGYLVEPIFSATPSPVNFGRVFPGSPKTDTVTVRNVGFDSLFITSVTTTDPQFTVAPLTARLDTNKATPFLFTFSPAHSGTSNALVIFAHNGSKGHDTIAVSGIGAVVTTLLEAVKDTNGDRKPDRLGDTVTIIGIINSVNVQNSSGNLSYFVQDDTAGINLFAFSASAITFNIGDQVRATGVINWYRGTTELIPVNPLTDVVRLASGLPVKVVNLTLKQYLARPEAFESRTIRFAGVSKIATSPAWPGTGADANMLIWDGKDTLTFRVDLDTDLPGKPEPVWPIAVKGVATQFSTPATATNNGYQLTPNFYADITQNVQVPPNPSFALLSPANSSVITVFPDLTYDFIWRPAIDLNNDTLTYQFKIVGASGGENSNNGGKDNMATLAGSTLLGYITGDSVAARWTVLAKDPTNPAVASVDTFAITLKRGILVPGWRVNASNTSENLWGVKTINEAVAWAGGDKGVVLRTVDAGQTWTNVGSGAMGAEGIWDLDAVDANTAFVSTSPTGFTYIFRTTNGGAHWDTVFTLANGFIDGIHMYDVTNGIAFGDPVGGKWVVLKTADGGAHWNRIATEPAQAGAEAGWNNAFAYYGNNLFLFGTNNSRIYRTTDAGATWSFAGVPLANVFGIALADSVYGVALVQNGAGTAQGLLRTIDGGTTWNSITAPGTGTISAAAAAAGKVDFWIGRDVAIYRSTNRGQTWNLEWNLGGAVTHASFVKYGSSASGWVVGLAGAMAGDYITALTGVGNNGMVLPEIYALEQNYPNPFNPTTTIRYALPATSRVTLKIYNVLGQLVTQLRDEVQSAGTYNVVWDGSNSAGMKVSSGVYLYHLEAAPSDGSQPFVISKKMIMLK
jgi:photosystem II stability/assembly factor-like uncharacterized protein